jgi:nucleotide-binding universal stress UspA family protein
MLTIERILCPVDFSEFSDRACDHAHSFARHFGAKLFVLHVAEPFVPMDPSSISPSLIDQVYAQNIADAEEKVRELAVRQTGMTWSMKLFWSEARLPMRFSGSSRVTIST